MFSPICLSLLVTTRGAHHLHMLQVLELLCRCGSEVGKATRPVTQANKKCASWEIHAARTVNFAKHEGGQRKDFTIFTFEASESLCCCVSQGLLNCLPLSEEQERKNWKLNLLEIVTQTWFHVQITNWLLQVHFNANVWFKSEHQVPEPTFFLCQILLPGKVLLNTAYQSDLKVKFNKSKFKIHLNYLLYLELIFILPQLHRNPRRKITNLRRYTTPNIQVLTHVTIWKGLCKRIQAPKWNW